MVADYQLLEPQLEESETQAWFISRAIQPFSRLSFRGIRVLWEILSISKQITSRSSDEMPHETILKTHIPCLEQMNRGPKNFRLLIGGRKYQRECWWDRRRRRHLRVWWRLIVLLEIRSLAAEGKQIPVIQRLWLPWSSFPPKQWPIFPKTPPNYILPLKQAPIRNLDTHV